MSRMGERTMAKNKSNQKIRLVDLIILLFVIVTMILLIVQLGMNVMEIVN